MDVRNWLRPMAAALVLWAHVAFAAADNVPTAERGAQQVLERKVAEYRQVLASFDAAMAAAPDDAAIAVERCRFIGQYTDDEYGEYIDSAPQEFTACQEAVEARWKQVPVAQLFALEQLWGEEAVERGEPLLEQAAKWPPELRRRLLAKVSEAQEEQDNFDRAGELAVQAAQLGENGRVARAVRYLAGRKEFAQAAKLLSAAPPATEMWVARERVEAALELPDQRAALEELKRYAGAEWKLNAAVAARAYLRAGEVAAARRLLDEDKNTSEPLQKMRFDAAMTAGDTKAAVAAVRLTDTEHFAENLQRFMILARRAPSTLLQGPMLLGALVFSAIGLVLALLPALLLVPVHYRGLIRRARGRPAVPLFQAVGLSRAWWAGAVFLAVPSLAAMAAEPDLIPSLLDESVLRGPGAFRAMLWGALAGLVFLLPATRRIGANHLVGDRVALQASLWRVPVAWACLIGTGMLIAWWHGHVGGGGETMQTKAMDALASGGKQAYGPFATLMLVAVLAPIFEELTFRGLLLGGLTRHISFGWANTLQALLFAVAHGDPPRFVFYLAMGLLAGWLVKRTNALGPAIALHALNNALAFSLLMMRH